jgi:hypothetical protein
MRHILTSLLIVLAASCGGDSLLGPVTNCNGQWTGIQNGYNLNLDLAQTDSTVSGSVRMAGNAGFADGTVIGTCTAQSVVLAFDLAGYQSLTYIGALSSTAAKINGQLDGSGFSHLELDVAKQ